MSGIIIDIGTGDGKFVYELAKNNPDKFVIGIDASHAGLIEKSQKIYKKKSKGGLPNALFVLASVENLPAELEGIANQIFINFPWGSLLAGLVKVDEIIWGEIKKLCKAGTIIDIIFGYDSTQDAKEIKRLDLPDLNLDYIKHQMIPKLSEIGFTKKELREITNEDLKDYPSSWSKKLGFGKERQYYYMRLVTK